MDGARRAYAEANPFSAVETPKSFQSLCFIDCRAGSCQSGSAELVFAAAGVVPLADHITARTARLALALRSSPCPLQRAINASTALPTSRPGSTARCAVPGSIISALHSWLDVHESPSTTYISEAACPLAAAPTGETATTQQLLADLGHSTRRHHNALSEKETTHGSATRTFETEEVAPSYMAARVATGKTLIRFRNAHFASRGLDRSHRTVEATNAATTCVHCGIGPQAPEHTYMHCVSTTLQAQFMAEWTSDTVIFLFTTGWNGLYKKEISSDKSAMATAIAKTMTSIESEMYGATFKHENPARASPQDAQLARAHAETLVNNLRTALLTKFPARDEIAAKLARWDAWPAHRDRQVRATHDDEEEEQMEQPFKVPAPLIKRQILQE